MGSQSSSQGGSSGAGLAGAGIDALGNVASTIITNNANKQENDATRAYNLKMWNMTNEYNSPQQQMARYIAAGLNPNLIYGSGSSSSGNASQPSAASPVKYNAPQLDLNVLGALLQLAQLKMITQQTETEKAKTGIAEAASTDAYMKNLYNWSLIPGSNITGYGPIKDTDPLWLKMQKAKVQSMIFGNELTSANALNARTLADLNSRLRPYNMTANDSILARGTALGLQKGNAKGFIEAIGGGSLSNMFKSLWNVNKHVMFDQGF